MAEVLPVNEDLSAFLDTDNEWHFPVEDENGARLDPLGESWTADFEIADSNTKVPRLTTPAIPAIDPAEPTKSILKVIIPDTELQPGTAADEFKEFDYVYSLKRTNDAKEKILRWGAFHMLRARRSIP